MQSRQLYGTLDLPYFREQNGLEVYLVLYVSQALIIHIRTTVKQGHSAGLLRQSDSWWYKDDASATEIVSRLTSWHEKNIYAIVLRKVL